MADAEIIPLGTRGRPGRGSGREHPSSAARSLAGARPPRPSRAGASEPPADEPVTDEAVTDEVVTDEAVTDGVVTDGVVTDGVVTDGVVTDDVVTQAAAQKAAGLDRAGDAAADSFSPSVASAVGADPRPDADSGGEPGSADGVHAPEAPAEDVPAPALAPHPAAAEQQPGLLLHELVDAVTRAARVVFGDDAEHRVAALLAVLRRRVRGDYDVDDYGLDPDIAERLLIETVRPLATKWFRVEVRGAENIPTDGGALLVANHSGTVPLDGLITMFAVHETTGRRLRPLGADLIFRMPFFGELARKAGATLACNEDASRLLSDGELAGVWPEGFKGIGKPYAERYKLQRFGRGGFVSAAMRTGVPIVPCSIVGAEEIYPLVGNVPFLARLLGLPYIPVTPFFPLLGPLGLVPLPSKWLIEFGEPIPTDCYDTGAADDPMLVFNVTDQVRETIQQTLYSLLMRRKSVFY